MKIYLDPIKPEHNNWIHVRNFIDFCLLIERKYLLEDKFPEAISIAVDLSDNKYKATGVDAIKWLIEFIIANDIKHLPKFIVHKGTEQERNEIDEFISYAKEELECCTTTQKTSNCNCKN